MPVSKGKWYILTILDSFSSHLTDIPGARDRAIDAARGLYSFFLRQREIPRIISCDRGTHFTGEVNKNFCDMMSITRELHCPWRPQSSGNIERQHRTMKNALFMLCENRSCEWTDILESVGWLVGCVLWHINPCRLFNDKSIFKTNNQFYFKQFSLA